MDSETHKDKDLAVSSSIRDDDMLQMMQVRPNSVYNGVPNNANVYRPASSSTSGAIPVYPIINGICNDDKHRNIVGVPQYHPANAANAYMNSIGYSNTTIPGMQAVSGPPFNPYVHSYQTPWAPSLTYPPVHLISLPYTPTPPVSISNNNHVGIYTPVVVSNDYYRVTPSIEATMPCNLSFNIRPLNGTNGTELGCHDMQINQTKDAPAVTDIKTALNTDHENKVGAYRYVHYSNSPKMLSKGESICHPVTTYHQPPLPLNSETVPRNNSKDSVPSPAVLPANKTSTNSVSSISSPIVIGGKKKNSKKYRSTFEYTRKIQKCQFEGCNFQTDRTTNMNNHVRTHTGEKPYVCSIGGCNYRSAQVSNLRIHYKRKH